MAQPTRSLMQRELDLVKTAKLYLQGKNQSEISRIIGVTRQQISYDINDLYKRWLNESMQDMAEMIIREFKKIDLVESEAWDAWESSKRDSVKIQSKDIPAKKSYKNKDKDSNNDKNTHITEITETIEGQIPNVKYLDRICWCIESRLKIIRVLDLIKLKEKEDETDKEDEATTEVGILALPDNDRTSK